MVREICRRSASMRRLRSVSALSSATVSCPVAPTSDALKITSGMPLSMQVTSSVKGSNPSPVTVTVSRGLPVGSRPEQTEPAVSRKLISMGAELPGAPSMRAEPSYSTWPPGVCTVMSAAMPVFSVSTRKVLVSPREETMPVSSAKGTTPASMLPQLGVVSTVSLSGCSWAKRNSRSMPSLSERLTMPTLLVSGCAPPTPSICRLSGEPMAASSTRSRVGRSEGRSLARKKGPLEVPPRISRQGMAVCMAVSISMGMTAIVSMARARHYWASPLAAIANRHSSTPSLGRRLRRRGAATA